MSAYRVVQLEAENFKRLKAVSIPAGGEPGLVVIQGQNAQGKSSVIDAIWAALAGKSGSVQQPVREGEGRARVTVDLGDFIVTKRWTATGGSELEVKTRDGLKYPSPQKVLDGLIGALSFDPLAFAQADDKTQRATLLKALGLETQVASLEVERRQAYDERTLVNRDLKQVEAALKRFHDLDLPHSDADVRPVDVVATAAELRQAEQDVQALERTREQYIAQQRQVEHLRDQLKAAEADLAMLGQEGARLEQVVGQRQAESMMPENLQTALSRANDKNQLHQQWTERNRALEQREATKGQSDRLSMEIARAEQRKRDLLEGPELAGRLPGIGISNDGVLLHGVPFSQASAAQRLVASVGLAMALNPQVRVIRVTDGSLLDDEHMALLERMAQENETQVWVERVGTRDEVGFVIADGSLVID